MNKKILLHSTTAGLFVLGACGMLNAETESNLLLMIPPLIAAGSSNSEVTDCNGVPGGSAIIDACGVCGGDGSSCGTNIQTVTSLTGQVWMDRNLGATQAAVNMTDASSYGDLYQWGRLPDKHEKRTSATTSTLSTHDSPGHDAFIIVDASPDDWRSPQNNNLWQNGTVGINNPCPQGFRLPTAAEFQEEIDSWSSQDPSGAFSSPLKLVMGGFRTTRGMITGGMGLYWSSTIDDNMAKKLEFYNFGTGAANSDGSFYRACGLSVRCIKD